MTVGIVCRLARAWDGAARLALLVTLLAVGCRTASPPAPPHVVGTMSIDGSTAVVPLAESLVEAYRRAGPAARVAIGPGMGSAARLDAVMQGRIDIALASHGVDSAALAARGLVAHEVARSAVVFAVHPASMVRDVDSRQLCDVYAGAVGRWSALGGADLAIVSLTRPAGEVDADVVLAGIPCFRAAAATGHARLVERPEEMAGLLATTVGAIGMTSMPFVERSRGALRALWLNGVAPDAMSLRTGRYPLVRSSYLVTRGDPSPAVRHFLAFVRSDRGRQAVQANGALPVP